MRLRPTLRHLPIGGLMGLLACGGPPGEPGLAGEDGEDGLNGADGQDGGNGADGQDGGNGADGAGGADGVDGVDGQDGQDGVDGRDGHNGDAPWGIHLDLLSVDGGTGPNGELQVGDTLSVTFSVLDDDDREYDLTELAGLSFQLSGPTGHYQNVLQYNQIASPVSTSVYNFDGTWTYTADLPIPATYLPPLNDTPDLGTDDGDWSGEPLDDGTYTLAAWAYARSTQPDGSTLTQSSNVTRDLLFGAATTLEPREVVLQENCAQCHGDEFEAHGGPRRDLDVCLSCHVDGAEDRYSATDPTLTPGVTISMRSMVHKLHSGSLLVDDYVVAGYASDPAGVGYPDYNLVDFSDVVFPSWPMATANCDLCHGGAAQGDVNNRPSREDCGSCHDSIDFAETDPSAADYHAGGPQADDSNCTVCHNGVFVAGYHADPRDVPTTWSGAGHGAGNRGLNIEILGAVDQTGQATFDVGDEINLAFTVKYDDGTDVPQSFFAYSATSSTCGTIAGGATVTFAGPSDHLQRVMISPSPSSTTIVGSVFGSSVVSPTTGIWTYTLQDTAAVPYTIPATFPAQPNDTLLVGTAWGDWVGQPLAAGTYRLAVDMYTTMWEDPTCVDSVDRVRANGLGTFDVLVGGATTLEPHEVVDDAQCESCHANMEFHGSTRTGVDYCVTCHTPGSADDAANPLVTVDFPVMIHKLHASDSLESPYVIDGSTFDITFPRIDGGVQACQACHGSNEAYLDASTRACVTCHDSADTVAHAAINSDPVFGESCDVCHGPSREFSVESSHVYLR